MPKQKPCILAVDDDVQILSLVRHTLEMERFRVITADSGKAALATFEQQPPDVVLLDIMLPGIDGYVVCHRIRSSSHVPIIMLTGMGSDEEKVRGLDAGADDYVTKPFSTEVLLARIRAMLRRSQATSPTPSDSFKSGNLEIDFTRRRVAVAAARTAVSTAAPVSHGEGRHVTRDYSYVRTEIWRIAMVAGFIIVSLILTAVFLR